MVDTKLKCEFLFKWNNARIYFDLLREIVTFVSGIFVLFCIICLPGKSAIKLMKNIWEKKTIFECYNLKRLQHDVLLENYVWMFLLLLLLLFIFHVQFDWTQIYSGIVLYRMKSSNYRLSCSLHQTINFINIIYWWIHYLMNTFFFFLGLLQFKKQKQNYEN